MAFFGQKKIVRKCFNQKSKSNGAFTSTGGGFPPAGQPPTRDQRVLGEKPQVRAADNQPQNDKPDKGTVCHICKKLNHSTMRCWHRFKQTYQPGNAAQALVAIKPCRLSRCFVVP